MRPAQLHRHVRDLLLRSLPGGGAFMLGLQVGDAALQVLVPAVVSLCKRSPRNKIDRHSQPNE